MATACPELQVKKSNYKISESAVALSI